MNTLSRRRVLGAGAALGAGVALAASAAGAEVAPAVLAFCLASAVPIGVGTGTT